MRCQHPDGTVRNSTATGDLACQCLLGIAVVMLVSDSVLVLADWADVWLALVSFVVLVGLRWRDCSGAMAAGIAVFGGLVICAGAHIGAREPTLRLVLISWLFGLLYLAERWPPGKGHGGRPGLSAVLHLASLAYGLATAVYLRSDWAWFLLRSVSIRAFHVGAPVGAWVSGLPVYLYGAMMIGGAIVARGAGVRRLLCLIALAGGFIVCRTALSLSAPVTHLKVTLCHLGSLIFVAFIASRAITWHRPEAVGDRPAWNHRLARRMLPLSLALTAACLAASIWPCVQRPSAAQNSPASLAIFSKGLLDWRSPDKGHLGLAGSGMFGLFRRTLERWAHQAGGSLVILGESGTQAITRQSLSACGAVIFINPTSAPDAAEIACLREFVESGGGLLVMGDHTDIGGSQAPLNAILSFSCIRLNFDSAVPLRKHWRGCLQVRPHPVTRSLTKAAPVELVAGVAVGASLAVERPASPLIIGKCGFADCGDHRNDGIGAFMGNVLHDRMEQLGDVVLVAAQRVGKGRVLVFGDTSPFQNGSLLLTQDLVSGALAWVVGTGPPERFADIGPYENTAIIDFSLHPRASVSLFTDTSLGGLANCLARKGISARPGFSAVDWGEGGRYLFVTSPTWIGSTDAERLSRYMADGGNLVLCQGYARPQPSANLLRRMGFDVDPIPLGNGDGRVGPAHREAWAVSYQGVECGEAGARPGEVRAAADEPCESYADTAVVASAFGLPTVVTRRCGRGSFTIVADGRLLLDDNLESERRANLRNVDFLGELLDLVAEDVPSGIEGGRDERASRGVTDEAR